MLETTPARLALGLTGLAGATATAALAGLWIGIPALTRWGQTTPMRPLTAVTVLVACVSLILLLRGSQTHRARTFGRVLGALVSATGVLSAADKLLDLGLNLNARLFGIGGPEIATSTGVALALLGAALLVYGSFNRASHYLAGASGAMSAGALIGYALYAPAFSADLGQMAAQTAGSLAALSAAVIIACPSGGPAAGILFSRNLGGTFARRALPVVIAIPVLVAIAATAAAQSGLLALGSAAWGMTCVSVALLIALTTYTAMLLERYDRHRRAMEDDLGRLAGLDPLTNMFNRRAFEQELQRATEHAVRYPDDQVSVCVCDLDGFKQINDLYGHAAGDEALQRIARALSARVRSTDVLARIGGDEFAVLLARADERQAAVVADDLQRAVAEVSAQLSADSYPNHLSVSIGFAAVRPQAPEAAVVAMRTADERMYAAKRARQPLTAVPGGAASHGESGRGPAAMAAPKFARRNR